MAFTPLVPTLEQAIAKVLVPAAQAREEGSDISGGIVNSNTSVDSI